MIQMIETGTMEGIKTMRENIVEKVNKRIDQIEKKRSGELEKLQGIVNRAQERKKAAEEAMKDAVETENTSEYGAAKARLTDAQNEIELFSAKIEKVKAVSLVTDEENGEIIRQIKETNAALEKEYKTRVSDLLNNLLILYHGYTNAIQENDQILRKWCDRMQTSGAAFTSENPYLVNPFNSDIRFTVNTIEAKAVYGNLKGYVTVPNDQQIRDAMVEDRKDPFQKIFKR